MNSRRFQSVMLFALIVGSSASAADGPAVPARKVAPPVTAYNWSGFYLGGNVGYGVGRNQASEILVAPPNPPLSSQSFTLGPAGWLGGGQIGYNWQTGNWVFGIEADWQWTGQKDSVCITFCVPNTSLIVTQEFHWLATLRARIGHARDGWLWYLTGGAAWGRVTQDDVLTFPNALETASFSHTQGGWTIGGGVETALAGAWTGKLEYLYVDLGSTTDAFTLFSGEALFTQTIVKPVREHIIRLGLNYRVGGGAAGSAVYAKVPNTISKAPPAVMVSNWAGFYLGGNVGYGVGRNHGNETHTSLNGALSTQFTLGPAGWLAGGQAGYNWQRGNWVFGVEADWQWTGQEDSVCVTVCTSFSTLTLAQEIEWFATLRGRIGYARDGWLWYVTGGGAWGRVTETDALFQVTTPLTAARFTHTKGGWTIGGGVETALTGNWSAKFEYLYVDLGRTTDVFSYPLQGGTAAETITKQVHDHIYRVGLNYRFGDLRPVISRAY